MLEYKHYHQKVTPRPRAMAECDHMRGKMELLQKVLKTYGKEGKRKYQQIKINKGDKLEDGTVYIVTEAQYEVINTYQTDLKKCKESLANATNNVDKLNDDLEEVTLANERQLQGLQTQIRKLEEDKTRYKILSETRQTQLEKLESDITKLTEKLEHTIGENGKLQAQLENQQTQIEALTSQANKKDKVITDLQAQLQENEKATLSELYMIHSRLTSLSFLDLLRGRHKPIIKEILPAEEIKEVETTTNE